MLQLGAKLFHKVGLGDYQHDIGYEGEFDPWLSRLWGFLKVILPETIKMILEPESNSLLPSVYDVRPAKMSCDTLDELPKPYSAINKRAYMCKVIANKRLTSDDHFQDTRCITLSIKQVYQPGDIVVI